VSGPNGRAPVLIRHYTDPTCPYAFSAERRRLRLLWLYGEQIDWELHMVALRVLNFSALDLDDPAVIERAASEALIEPAELGGPEEERRYTCPSYELIRLTEPPVDWPTASRVDLPGYRPVEAYEAALANIGPELVRRPDPDSVEEVLAWAGMPVATAEVTAVCDREVADVRTELARVGTFLPVGGDGYWTAAA
jgi:hypothetical protein